MPVLPNDMVIIRMYHIYAIFRFLFRCEQQTRNFPICKAWVRKKLTPPPPTFSPQRGRSGEIFDGHSDANIQKSPF